MENPSIKQHIRNFIGSNFYIADSDALEDHASLLNEGVIDSTGVIEIIGFLESAFGISVQDAEIIPDNLDSIDRIAGYVARKLGSEADLDSSAA